MDLLNKKINNKYYINRKIGEGSMGTVWLAEDLELKNRVALKLLNKSTMSRQVEDTIRFKNEAHIISKLNLDNIVKIYEVGNFNDNYYIAMEYIEGDNLYKLLKKNQILSLSDKVELIYNISDALNNVHKEGIVYRDLKPNNIIVYDKNNFSIKLIDFGLAQIREFDDKNQDDIVGTIYYMSPEQCGVSKVLVDERSDLYSLGVLFYKVLTGYLPFEGLTINEIIHKHAAFMPKAPIDIDLNIPEVVSKIVMKLINKNPEERYQSAKSLLKDLGKIKNNEMNFIIGQHDDYIKLNFRSKLIGRDKEINKLKKLYKDANCGKGNICLIGGESGKGKTRLIEEFINYVNENNGILIYGKCNSEMKEKPYISLNAAFDSFINLFNKFNDGLKAKIIERIKIGINDLGEVIRNFNQKFEVVITDYKKLESTDEIKENTRLKKALSHLLYSIGSIQEPLVLVLDDLQWIDIETLNILNELLNNININPLLVVGAYRNNEVDNKHILSNFINDNFIKNESISKINLKSFGIRELNTFLSEILFDSGKNIRQIADFINKKSGGNPFFTLEILKQLIREKGIVRSNGKWNIIQYNIDKINILATAIDTIIYSINKLSKNEIIVLSYAAAISGDFSIEILIELININKKEVVNIVDKGIKMHFIESSEYNNHMFIFVHDRIKEAFYKNMSHKEKTKIHLKIARILEKKYNEGQNNLIYELVTHYIISEDNKKVLEYINIAAMKSKENFAYESSFKYLKIEKKLLEISNKKDNKRWNDVCKNAIESAIYCSKSFESIDLSKKLIKHIEDKYDKAYVYYLLARAYFNIDKTKQGLDYSIAGIDILGDKKTKYKMNIKILILYELIKRSIISIASKSVYIKKNNKNSNKKYKLLFKLYRGISIGIAIDYREYVPLFLLKTINLCESKIGWSKELISANVGIGMLFAQLCLYTRARKYFDKAFYILNYINDQYLMSDYYKYLGYMFEFSGSYKESIEAFNNGLQILKYLGDNRDYTFTLNGILHQYYFLGEYETMFYYIEEYNHYYKKEKNREKSNGTIAYYVEYYREIGEYEKAKELRLKDKNFIKYQKEMYPFEYCVSIVEFGILYFETREYKKSKNLFLEAIEMIEKNIFIKHYTVNAYPLYVETLVEMYKYDKKSETLNEIKKYVKILLKKTYGIPAHIGLSYRAIAKYYELIGKNQKVEKNYKKAISNFSKISRKYEIAKTIFYYGQFLKSTNNYLEYKKVINESYEIFKEINSKYYMKICEEILKVKKEEITEGTSRFLRDMRSSERMKSIIGLSHEISSILNLKELIDKIMDVALETTGSQNGYFLFKKENKKNFDIVVSKFNSLNVKNTNTLCDEIVQMVIEKKEIFIIANAEDDEDYNKYENIKLNKVKSILCIPIKYKDELIGICYLDNCLTNNVFNKEDVGLMNIFMSQAAISIKNAELYQYAVTDRMTGLYNHVHFKKLLEEKVEEFKQTNKEFVLLMFDIDHFKNFNDNFGHQAGDEVIVEVAKIAKENFRKSDIVSRYGGEEFAIILNDTSLENGFEKAENLRKEIEKKEIIFEKKVLKVTISIGIDLMKNGDDSITLLKSTDYALYSSKKAGRNKVSVYE